MNSTSTPINPDPFADQGTPYGQASPPYGQAGRTPAAAGQPASAWGWSLPPERAGEVAAWLDRCEADLVHPAVVDEQLKRSGWHPAHAAAAAERYRTRFNEHTLGYSALLFATGISALAAGTAGHILTAGIDHPVNRNALGFWLATLVCALPFAMWAHHWAATVDREDPVAVWSRPRRTLARVLLLSCGVVGIVRLMLYARQLVGVLVGASWAAQTSVLTGAVNVAITVAIALPLGLWSFGFLHRFDREDPTVPARHGRRRST